MNIRRMALGMSVLFATAWIGNYVSNVTVGSVTITSICAFAGGLLFASGWYRR